MQSASSIMAAVCLMLAFSIPSAASPFPGLTITRITVQDDQGNPWHQQDQVSSLIMVKPGGTFSSEAIRQGIEYAYLTGRFRDVRVDGFPDKGGVRLVYTLVPVTLVDKIVVRGNHALSNDAIRDVLRGVEGRELREDRFPDYRTGILAAYQSEGYYGATVDFKVVPQDESHHVALAVYVREPKRTIIADVEFSGNTVFTGKQLLRVMKSRPGGPLRTDILFDKDMAAILELYTDEGYPAAKPGPVDIRFQDEKAYVLVSGKEGPRVTVGFSGNRAFGDGELRRQVLIWSEHDVSDSIIDSSADKIRNLYRDDGYDAVKVLVKKIETATSLDLVFHVEEGPRVTVKKIVVSGNSYFPTSQIKGELSLQESGLLSSSPFNQALVDKAADYLRERYQNAGFLSVNVKRQVDLVDRGKKAVVRIDIDEGPQTTVGSVAFEGNTVFTAAELTDKLALKPGTPYNERLIDEDRYRILSAYSDKGYLYARVDAERQPAGGAVSVKYRITEDGQVRAGMIVLRGNERTKDRVIRRELLLKPGDPYNYEDILKSQQRIYRFGYFNQVRFEPVHPGEKEYVKDMILSIEERPAGSFEVGFGYGDLDRARAFLEVSHRNLWGLAHYGGVRFEKSDILTRAILNYQHPWSFGYDLQGKFALNWSDYQHINSDTREIYYRQRQTTASYGVEKNLERLKLSLTYAFENVQNLDVKQGVNLPYQDVGHVQVSSISPAAVWDSRDDIFNPRTGALYGIVLKQAMHQIGSEADFTKVSVQSSWYAPVSRGIVAALSARGGLAWPHYDTVDVPLHERFTLGGSTTIRGYTQDLVGSKGTITVGPDGKPFPLGGTGMALFNLELRFMPTEGFGFVLFSDAGNVWTDQQIKLNDLRASYGAGIRYGTPIGPLRIDYGWKIHRRPDETAGELHFNIGHTF